MRVYSLMFGSATVSLSLPSLTISRGSVYIIRRRLANCAVGQTFRAFCRNHCLCDIAGFDGAFGAGPRPDLHYKLRDGEPGHRPTGTNGHFRRHDHRQSERVELSCRIFFSL